MILLENDAFNCSYKVDSSLGTTANKLICQAKKYLIWILNLEFWSNKHCPLIAYIEGTKEQAYVYALASAAVTHHVAKACVSGDLPYCPCGLNSPTLSADISYKVFLIY